MTRRTVIAGGVLLLFVAAVAGWYYLSPGWTLRSMVEAAKADDEERFSSYVDYPALREDLSAEMGRRLKAEADRDGNPAAQLGAAMGMALMKPLVDNWEKLMPDLLAPLGIPRHPVPFARFGLRARR